MQVFCHVFCPFPDRTCSGSTRSVVNSDQPQAFEAVRNLGRQFEMQFDQFFGTSVYVVTPCDCLSIFAIVIPLGRLVLVIFPQSHKLIALIIQARSCLGLVVFGWTDRSPLVFLFKQYM